MSDFIRRALWGPALAYGLGLGGAPAVAEDGSSWHWSGDYKNLLLQSKTSPGDRYALDRNRLRVALRGSIGNSASVDLQYDNELLVGGDVGSAEFRQQRYLAPPQYGSLQSDYIDGSSVFGHQSLYRASINFALGQTDVRLGRQRITWGTGRFWSPLDLLNPVTPIALDRTERLGVDAVLVEHRMGPLSRAAVVYAPDHDRRGASRALLWHDNAGGVDYSMVAGRFRRERVMGVDLATAIGPSVVRAEWTRVRPPSGATFTRALLGFDLAFANSLTLSAELYRDGSGAADPALYDFSGVASGERRTVARRYLGLRATYDVSPLVKWTGELVINLVDRSRYFSPAFTWSVRPDLDWSLGVQHFSGSAASELGRLHHAAYSQLQWFF